MECRGSRSQFGCKYVTLAIMPFTYNISYGIAFGLISYIVISCFCGDFKKIKASSWIHCVPVCSNASPDTLTGFGKSYG